MRRRRADPASPRLALYRLTLPQVSEALIAAANRGADVEVILDGQGINDEQSAVLSAGLGPGRVHRCGGLTDDDSCIGPQIKPNGDAINHNKFLLVSALDSGAEQVVWQSSSNATFSQLAKGNDALVVRDDATLYDSYVAYFEDLRAGAMGAPIDPNDFDTTDSSIAGDTGTRLYLFPRADINVADGPGYHVNGEDPLLTFMGNLGCDPGDRILVGMALWKDDRIEIVDRLASLANEGCQVEVILRADPTKTDPVVLTALLAAGLAGVYDVPHLHSKYVVGDCLFKDEPRKLLWTGSHNFTYGALRENDEAIIRVDDSAVHAQYVTAFEALRDADGEALL